MTEPRNQRDLLVRYLLGEASTEDRTQVEEQYFSDDTGVEVLLKAEDELIDDYVRGALSASDRQAFESHFLCTKERKRRLEMVQSMVDVLSQMELAEQSISYEARVDIQVRPASMVKTASVGELTASVYERLMNWLDSDYQRAGEKYVDIRNGLVRFFTFQGVFDAEELADKTVERVALRVSELSKDYKGDPRQYFLRAAKFVLKEHQKAKPVLSEAGAAYSYASEEQSNQADECLNKCLQELSIEDRYLILQYYRFDKTNKHAHTKIAASLGISVNALRLRVFRLRKTIKNCVEACLERK